MSRVQVNNEDGNPRDQDRELLIFSNMLMIHVYMPIFQWESKFRGHKGDKFHIEGPGEQWGRQPKGPGQGVAHFFKYAYDTCLYANFSMGIQISGSQGWQIPYQGSRWTMRMATPGTRTGCSSFFFKYAYDTCLYVNYSMRIRIFSALINKSAFLFRGLGEKIWEGGG